MQVNFFLKRFLGHPLKSQKQWAKRNCFFVGEERNPLYQSGELHTVLTLCTVSLCQVIHAGKKNNTDGKILCTVRSWKQPKDFSSPMSCR